MSALSMPFVYESSRQRGLAIAILHEDNHVLVAEKPAGILSQADKTGRPDMLTILKDYLKERYQKKGEAWLGLVHRLDQPVAGVMVFAKTSKAASRLSESFRSQAIHKGYLAVVHGRLDEAKGRWEDTISTKKERGRYKLVPKGAGKPCDLAFRRLAVQGELSLLSISLGTGRAHQIRVQSLGHGHPILGDRRYGKNSPKDRAIKAPALYAMALEFPHPTKAERVVICQPLPAEAPWNLFSGTKIERA